MERMQAGKKGRPHLHNGSTEWLKEQNREDQ
jgi:hypothetical protein